MNRFKKLQMSVVLGLPLLAVSGISHAEGRYGYAAAHCDSVSGAAPTRTAGGSVVNSSTTATGTYLCPIVLDTSGTGVGITSVQVTYRDQNVASGADVSCLLAGRTSIGVVTAGSMATRTSSAGSSPESAVFNFGSVTTFLGGFATLECTLPRNVNSSGQGASRIYSYSVTQPG
ncbi:MAG: hypothetical protein ACT4QA_02145 [Panacagrimonas sp.]